MKHLQAIKAKLKAQHPGLPQAILDRVADTLAKTAKDEATDEELTQAVANHQDVVTSLAEFAQQEGDRRATEAQKKAEDKSKAPTTPATPANPASAGSEPAKQEGDNEVLALLKGLSTRLESFEKKEAAKSHGEVLSGLLKDKVPASYYGLAVKGREFKDADEVNAFAAEIESQYTAFQQEQANGKLGQQTPPAQGAAAAGDEKEKIDPVEQAYLDSKNPKPETK